VTTTEKQISVEQQTVVDELFGAPVRVAEVRLATAHGYSVVEQRLAQVCDADMVDSHLLQPPVEINFLALGNRVSHLVASIIGMPLEAPCKIVSSLGRVAVVDYTPAGFADPDLLVWWGAGAREFHKKMRSFQNMREYGGYGSTHWYASVKKAGHVVLKSLLRLQPHFAEFDFAATWILDTATFNRRIF